MENEVIETRTNKIWLEEDGIVRAVNFPNAKITLEDAKENVATVKKLIKGRKCPLLVDISKVLSLDRDARKYYAEAGEKENISAVALLVGPPLSKVIGNFFIGLNRGVAPLRLFTSEARAIEWLKGFVE